MKNLIFVKENETSWELWTDTGLYNIVCSVEKGEDQVENIIMLVGLSDVKQKDVMIIP